MTRIVALLLLLAAPVFAQPTPEARDKARAHFKQGRAYQEAGAYTQAVAEFEAAYALDPLPELLFNIGQALRLAGRKQDALDRFKQYLEVQPNGRGADEARQHVATLTRELEAEKPAPAADPVPAPAADPVPAPAADPAPAPAPAPAPLAAPVARDDQPRPGGTLRLVGIITAGAGLVGIGVGVKFGLDASKTDDDLSGHTGPWTTEEMEAVKAGESAEKKQIIFTAVGAGLVVTGGVLYYLGYRAGVAPVVSASSAGLVVAGSF
jgi:hypothetical protein